MTRLGQIFKVTQMNELEQLRAENTRLIAERDEAQTENAQLAQTVKDWVKCNSPGGWIDDLRGEVARLTTENERLSALADRWNTEGDAMREDNKRLAAELAEIKNSMAYRTSLVGRLEKELAELRAQEPVGEVDEECALGREIYIAVRAVKGELKIGDKLYAHPVPAAQAVETKRGALVPLETLETWLALMEADWKKIDNEWGPSYGGLEAAVSNGECPELSVLRAFVATAHSVQAPAALSVPDGYVLVPMPADHVPDATETIELLREIETRYLADLLSHSISGLGYPVGCGIPPSDDHAMKAAGALFDRFVGIAAAMQKGAK